VGVCPRAVFHSPFQISHITSVNDISWRLRPTGRVEKNKQEMSKEDSKSYPQKRKVIHK
jgi:hypothetical protein